MVLVDDVSAFPMQTTVEATGPSWSGIGMLPITIRVMVNASATFPVRLMTTPLLNLGAPLAGPTSSEGSANSLLTMAVNLG
jgi:hypothetical protein